METINERIYKLRKELSLSQDAFGEKIGIKKASISMIEKGKNNPSEQTIKSICREFNVSYAWLVEGIGEIFIETDDVLLEALLDEYDLDEDEVQLITKLANTYLQLDKSNRRVLIDFMKSLLDGQ
ncbi:MAG: helix-turn-helix domain-containing protein [Faecalibacillus faecis]|uniref:helix-turn-helix domain-containing protein n=1 Tax=Faecalibacillus faecis TaxID=1982628 RepID=UPI00399668D6